MFNIGLFAGALFAIIFYRAADHERMSPIVWAGASFGLTVITSLKSGSLLIMLLSQLGLFGVMWWYNIRRHKDSPG